MPASYPTSVPTFTTKTDDVDTAQAGHVNALQDEVNTIASGLLNGAAHVLKPEADGTRDLGTSSLRWRDLLVTRQAKISGVTVTADTPPLDLAQTWNAAGVTFDGIKLAITDTASAAASRLFRLLVGGVTKFEVDKDGDIKPRGVDYTWPAAVGAANQFLKTDASGNLSWAATVLDRDVTLAEVVNTVTETTVYSFPVPANTLGSTHALRFTMICDYLNNSGGSVNLTVKVKFGATTIYNSGATSMTTDASRRGMELRGTLAAANATNAQRSHVRWIIGAVGTAAGTAASAETSRDAVHNAVAEDSTAGKTLEITITHGTANANVSFRAHSVFLEFLD